MHYKYGHTPRKWHRDDMDVDAIFQKLAELSVNVNKALNLMDVQLRHMSGGKVDILKLADGIDKANEDLLELMQAMIEEGKMTDVDEKNEGDAKREKKAEPKRKESNAEAKVRMQKIERDEVKEVTEDAC